MKVEIDNHPFNSIKFKTSNEIIENCIEEQKDNSEIRLELASRSRPSLDQGGPIVLKGMRSFGRLHRTRVRLEKSIKKLANKRIH